jgi:hypothetical protein
MENVSNVSLSNMTFGSTVIGDNLMSNFGIRGTNVNNFTLRDSQFLGSFGDSSVNGLEALHEGTIRFGAQGNDGTGNGLTGTALFSGNTIGGGFGDNLAIFNNNTGSLNMTVNDSANGSTLRCWSVEWSSKAHAAITFRRSLLPTPTKQSQSKTTASSIRTPMSCPGAVALHSAVVEAHRPTT